MNDQRTYVCLAATRQHPFLEVSLWLQMHLPNLSRPCLLKETVSSPRGTPDFQKPTQLLPGPPRQSRPSPPTGLASSNPLMPPLQASKTNVAVALVIARHEDLTSSRGHQFVVHTLRTPLDLPGCNAPVVFQRATRQIVCLRGLMQTRLGVARRKMGLQEAGRLTILLHQKRSGRSNISYIGTQGI